MYVLVLRHDLIIIDSKLDSRHGKASTLIAMVEDSDNGSALLRDVVSVLT